MVENAVHNHAQPPPVGFLHQPDKKPVAGFQVLPARHAADIPGGKTVFLLPLLKKLPLVHNNFAKVGVNIIIVLNVILMVRGRDKQRVKINNIHPQILQVIQLVNHPLQVAPVKFPYIHLRRIALPILHPVNRLVNIQVFARQHVIGRVAVTESVHINLIHDGSLRPIWRLKAGNNDKIIVFVYFLHQAPGVIIARQPPRCHLEIVCRLFVLQLKLKSVIVKMLCHLNLVHDMLFAFIHQEHPVHIMLRRAEPNRNLIKGIRLRGSDILLRGVGVQCPPVKDGAHLRYIPLIVFQLFYSIQIKLFVHNCSPDEFMVQHFYFTKNSPSIQEKFENWGKNTT